VPLDHFVSQVHLRNFYSPALGKRMHALRKSDLKYFCPDSLSVCRVEHGSTNPYLTDERAIEEFLRDIEPKYNRAVEAFSIGNPGRDAVYVLSGFVAYVLSCSPAGMRINSEPFRSSLEETGRILDARGEIGTPPAELGATSLRDLFNRKLARVEVDPKYPQAVGIASIHRMTNTFGNFGWEVLINRHADSPYFTSDFPVTIEPTADPRIIKRIVPLSPTVAVRLHPNLAQDTSSVDFSFREFRCRVRTPSRQEIGIVNRLLVQGAESLVFYRDAHAWVEPFVRKNAAYRIEAHTQRMPYNTGSLLLSSLRLCADEARTKA
jgi:hypothetical protein